MTRIPRRPTVAQAVADAWCVTELCVELADAWPELLRLAELHSVPDGYGTGCTDRGGPGTIADPSAATVFKLAGGRLAEETHDGRATPDSWSLNREQVGVVTDEMLKQFEVLVATARRIAGCKRLIEGRGDGRVGRQSSLTDCLACEKPVSGVGNDRIRAGYCPACHQGWLRYAAKESTEGREPIHETFRRRRRVQLAKGQAS